MASTTRNKIDLDRLDEKQRDALLRTLLSRGDEEDTDAYELAIATSQEEDFKPLARSRRGGASSKPGVKLPKETPEPEEEEVVEAEQPKRGAKPGSEASPPALRSYIVPDSAISTVVAAFHEPNRSKIEDAVSWTANQLRELYLNPDHHQIFWGPLERAAFDTLTYNRALEKGTQQRILTHVQEFDDFIIHCDDKEQLAFLDLPQIAAQISDAAADLGTLETIFKSRFQRVRKSHLYVYVDFLRVTRPFAILLKKEAEYKERKMTDQQIKRKLASARQVIQQKLKDTDPYVIHMYVEILRYALASAPQQVRDQSFDRIETVLGIGRAVLKKREKLERKSEAIGSNGAPEEAVAAQ